MTLAAESLTAFVINLPAAEGRRQLMRGQLEQPGMPSWRIVEGVDASRLQEAELARLYDEKGAARDYGRPLTRGEIGCALAHLAVYRQMVERAIPVALVLEDDALLGHQFLKTLHRLLPMIDTAQAQVVLLSHVGRFSAWGGRRVDKEHWLYRPYTAWGAHAYLMTLPAAKALAAYQQPVHLTADSWMHFQRAGLFRLLGVVPYIAGTAPLAADSQIGDERLLLNRRRGLHRWLHKYLWQKFVFQLVVKPALRLRKQPGTW